MSGADTQSGRLPKSRRFTPTKTVAFASLILFLLLVASAKAEPVYVWLGKGSPEHVIVNKGPFTSAVVINEAESQAAMIRMMAEAARKANCNGVLTVKTARIAKANTTEIHWEAMGILVTFRNPEKLDRRLTAVMR